MPKYQIKVTHSFVFDTDKYHDAEEGPPATQNFDPQDRDSVVDYLLENITIDVLGDSTVPDSVEIVGG